MNEDGATAPEPGDADGDDPIDEEPVPVAPMVHIDRPLLADVQLCVDSCRHELHDARGKQAESASADLRDGDISLLQLPCHSTCFVRWTNADAIKGRRIRLDEKNGIIADPAFRVQVEQFSIGDVVIRNTCSVLLKAQKSYRSQMLVWCIILKRWAIAQTIPEPLTNHKRLPKLQCVRCRAMTNRGEQGVDEAGIGELYVCDRCSRHGIVHVFVISNQKLNSQLAAIRQR